MQHTLAVFALGRRASVEMANQIKQFFSNHSVLVSAYCLDDLRQSTHAPVKADLAIISCDPVESVLAPYIDATTPTIVARRTLSLKAIDQLLELPAGSKALLVTKNTIGITEFMQTIQEMGISHIAIHSFLTHDYQTCSAVTTVLLADEPEQIPPWTLRTIDLGVREIELSSLIEMAKRLNHHLDVNTPLSTNYIQEIVSRSKRFMQTLKAVDYLNQQLAVVLSNIQDRVIAVDADCTIRLLNSAALDLIDTASGQAAGKPLLAVIPALEKVIRPDHSFSPAGNPLAIGARTFDVSVKTQRDKANNITGSIIFFRDVTEELKPDKEVRHNLRTRGHVAKYTFTDIIGEAPAIQAAVAGARKLAASDLNILIYGENGTGKELFAQAIHSASPRAAGPFVAANCAALPPSLLESELFGYEDGAFTGAKKGGKPGLIEQADGGTFFLDEIGDLPPEAQSRLLRVLQEKELMRVSSTRVIAVDIRVIGATNKNLYHLIGQGQFREDLFYRLFVAPLHIPPLRERGDDIALLLRHFMRAYRVDERFADARLIARLQQHAWPGNVRELQTLVQYAATLCADKDEFLQAIVSKSNFFRQPDPTLPINLAPDELPLYLDILSLFAAAKAQKLGLGRGNLGQQLRFRRGQPLNEQTIRNKMTKLKAAGFLSSGHGRQGTAITAAGEQFLATMGSAGQTRPR